jgi:hypothetical protein
MEVKPMGRREQSRTILVGAVAGAVVGVLLALLYGRQRQQRPGGGKPIRPSQVLRLGAALVPIVRQIADWLS